MLPKLDPSFANPGVGAADPLAHRGLAISMLWMRMANVDTPKKTYGPESVEPGRGTDRAMISIAGEYLSSPKTRPLLRQSLR
jgi:hypothetical protein